MSVIEHQGEEEEGVQDNHSLFEQEFTEQDVLPFLLQAQDIISKLESRVVELETDLSTIHCKYEHDRNEWLVGLSQKDQYINHLSSKLQKSEFNSKETIILLSDLVVDNTTTSMDIMKSTITLCLNYLRQTKVIVQQEDLEEGELERRQQAVTEWNNIPDNTEIIKSCDIESQVPTYTVNNNNCLNCKQLLSQLDQQIEQKAYLKRDLNSLASVLSEEQDLRLNIEQDKELFEKDIIDITNSLFLLLNEILMDEITDRDGIIQLHRETSGKLSSILDAWDSRDLRLKQVKELLVELDSIVVVSGRLVNKTSFIPFIPPTTTAARFSSSSSLSLQRQQQEKGSSTIRIDGFILSEFQQHVKSVMLDSKAITVFSKRVLQEDVEPCLFFQQSQGWWKSPWFKKRLLDAISKNKCEIQGWYDGMAMTALTMATTMTTTDSLSSSLSSSSSCSSTSSQPMAPKTKCACCNILRVCEFKMRLPIINTKVLQQQQQQPWLPIDRFCRDRLVAVCGYYSFMSHLKLLLNNNNNSILNLFKQVMFHRRKMNLARVGSIGLFLNEEEEDQDVYDYNYKRSSSCSRQQQYQQKRKSRSSIVLDHSGGGSDTASVVSVCDIQGGLEGSFGQIVIVH